MLKKKYTALSLFTVAAVAAVIGCMVGQGRRTGEGAQAEAGSPEQAIPSKKATGFQKGAYFPNTEKLAPDEMRVIALGTGLPTPLTKAQKSSSFMVELGNGEIFLFDCGTGSVENLFAIQPRFAKVEHHRCGQCASG